MGQTPTSHLCMPMEQTFASVPTPSVRDLLVVSSSSGMVAMLPMLLTLFRDLLMKSCVRASHALVLDAFLAPTSRSISSSCSQSRSILN